MKILAKRRRLENKTNYTKRKKLLEHSKSRIVIRKSNKYITIQLVESKEAQDFVKVHINSKVLLEHEWPKDRGGSLKSLGAAYLTGLLFGNKIKNVSGKKILDTGLISSTKGSRIYAAVKGIIDAGVEVPCSKEVMPEEARIISENVKSFFEKVKSSVMKGAK
jgi:large subunit ribosomal protein L18